MSNQRVTPLKGYIAMIVHGLDYWVVPGLRELRERVASEPLDKAQSVRLSEFDGYLVDAVTDLEDEEIPDELLQDNPAQPLSHWWWHLGKLRAGTYPAELLPEHLREIYRQQAAPSRVTSNALPL